MRDGQSSRRALHAVVAVAGAAAMVGVQVVGTVIGIGALLLVPLAGAIAATLVPRWTGWLALVAGLALAVVVITMGIGSAGPIPIVTLVMSMLATTGWFAGLAVVRARRLGLRATLRDVRFAGAIAGMAGTAVLVWLVMAWLSRPAA